MNVQISNDWKEILQEEFNKPYFETLVNFVKREYNSHTCYPPGSEIFSAFNHCLFNDLKVVIIGQDPYHGPNQANGLCFSVKEGISHPPSLKNIFKELSEDLEQSYPNSGDLSSWAQQGVLLLNATLTVRAHKAGSHQGHGWEQFTNAVIAKISELKKGVVFLLWGGFAKKKLKLINTENHHVLIAGHPSPLSANRGYWFGNKHFSKTNFLLEQADRQKIQWLQK